MTDSEHLDECWLNPELLDRLLTEQNECTFIWVNQAGQPFGVIMSYIYRAAPHELGAGDSAPGEISGSFWLTSAEKRVRVAAVRRTGYAAITVSSKGTSLGTGKTASFRGPCVVHDDRATRNWMLPELARALRPDSEEGAQAMLAHLDTPNRVVLQLTPDYRLDFDSRKMWTHARDAAPPGRL
jgi:hypothetical protein